MARSKKTSIKISTSTLSMLNDKRLIGIEVDAEGKEKSKYVEHDDFQRFLVDALEVLEKTAKGEAKAELHLNKFFAFGHDREITPSELRLSCGVNLNTCKSVMSRYVDKVDIFNSNFK